MKRQHQNLITNGVQGGESRRPLSYNNQDSPSVIGRPENIRNVVSLWGRIKAAWLVFTTNAYAVRWYNDDNAHTWTPDYWEYVTGGAIKHSDYMRSRLSGAKEANPNFIQITPPDTEELSK